MAGRVKKQCPYTPTQDLLVHIRSQVNLSRPAATGAGEKSPIRAIFY